MEDPVYRRGLDDHSIYLASIKLILSPQTKHHRSQSNRGECMEWSEYSHAAIALDILDVHEIETRLPTVGSDG